MGALGEPVGAGPAAGGLSRQARFAWALAVVASLLVLAACRRSPPAAGSGGAAATPTVAAADGGASVDDEAAAGLQALPYLQAYRRAEDRPLISHYDPTAVAPGLNLYVSGHAAEALLIDMQGRIVHRWRYPLGRAWPELAEKPGFARIDYWRHVHLFDDGRLLAIFDDVGLVALDARSHLLWTYRGRTHHDLYVDAEGNVHVLERITRPLPRMHPTRPVIEDFVTTLDSRGQLLRRDSVLEAVERSPFAGLLDRLQRRSKDIFHTNALEPLDGRYAGRNPAFRRGNVLISLRELHAVAVLDPKRNSLVWALTDGWRRQHSPSLVGSGNLLLFDNEGAGLGISRVLEVGTASGRTLWQYGGASTEALSSKTLGYVQRLANGNTLITDSHRGRAVEVTPQGRVVWDFYNPHRVGERDELVATLFEMERVPADLRFLSASGAAAPSPISRGSSRSSDRDRSSPGSPPPALPGRSSGRTRRSSPTPAR